jgi:ubiquinone/menaquinone biosynthesis C-methylase UbiE
MFDGIGELMPSLDHFGFIAPFYDRVIPLKKAQHLIDLLGLPVLGAVLDAGGGTGRVAQSFKNLASQIVIADLSYGMLSQSRRKNGLSQVCSETESLPFPNETFERIVMVDALHHVLSQKRTLNELWRVLVPDGRLVIEEPDISRISVKFVALFEKILLMRSHFIAPQEIASMFPHRNAVTKIQLDGFNAWIIVDKC